MSTPSAARLLTAVPFLTAYENVYTSGLVNNDVKLWKTKTEVFESYKKRCQNFSKTINHPATSMMMASPLSMLYSLKPYYTNMMFRFGKDPRMPQSRRKKIVLLGTGWATMSFLKGIDVTKYDVTVVAPTNYFSFTPFLPSVCAGSMSSHTCLEPIRPHFLRGKKKVMEFHEGYAKELDQKAKRVKCVDLSGAAFDVPYDYLVIGVGAAMNTFGIPGVEENSMYLKNVSDAERIHNKLVDCLEKASLPSTPKEEKERLLSFVIVGGGPSGVEVSAELCDFIKKELNLHYPQLKQYAKVTLIEMLPRLLAAFSEDVSEYTLKTLKDINCNVQLKSKVNKITPKAVHYTDEKNNTFEVPYGFVLWASGIGQTPFVKNIMETTEAQKTSRAFKIDQSLRVHGVPDCFAIGDCAFLAPKGLATESEKLFNQGKKGDMISTNWFIRHSKSLSKKYPQISAYDLKKITPNQHLTKEQFSSLLNDIDASYRPPPTTAQTAAQEAAYLTKIFNMYYPNLNSDEVPAWMYKWKGQMSYVGNGYSVIQTPYGTMLGGLLSLPMWNALYFTRQFSLCAQINVLSDWLKTMVNGRYVGRPR